MIVQKGFGQWFIHDMLKNPFEKTGLMFVVSPELKTAM